MIQLAFLLFVLTLGQDIEEEELSKKIGACWMKTIKDINNEKDNMGKIIESVQNANKTLIFHKIQMSMILQCESLIDINNENYLSLSYKDVVKDFDYKQYIGIEFKLTKEEETLLRIIKKMEKDLGELNKQNQIKQQYKQTQQVEQDWQDAYKTNQAVPTLLTKPNYFHYAFFLVLFVAIFGGGYWSVKMIQGMKDSSNKNQNKAK
ncbi:unnamed protein product (macronuclear) [Paramecium tetraurelia]|uniref:Transmembrane protein n=1 Tax=Paramecium tetraurelia TaxID=5888 RepID=A0ECA7_PARTE|nr:uncharacterized protein GSPATT00025661001 [Paramecium tetraurelia]CAK92924.1 unnamed protein product [Paramecium tetraurelia]|eukprot:XP_001460321.1 hypothetical protein (macronuclear) [Paramecium tetraurelia strain d4-2]